MSEQSATPSVRPSAAVVLTVSLIALSALMLEIVLTRIFSVTMWYHFAFMAVSLALLGTGASGMYIYLFPRFFQRTKLYHHLLLFSTLYSLSIIGAFLVHLGVPFFPNFSTAGLINMLLTFGVLTIPFLLAGLCISLPLTHLPQNVSLLYFADLVGAASGAMLAIPALNFLGGPGAVVASALIAGLAMLMTTRLPGNLVHFRYGLLAALGILAVLVVHLQFDFLEVVFVKGKWEPNKLFEGWNSFSQVAVLPDDLDRPFGWGLSEEYTGPNPGNLAMRIDATAGTPIVRFDGDLSKVDYLKYDVTSIAYYLKEGAKAFIIGPGGGRDILAAMVFKAGEVDAVEVNPIVVDAVNNHFGDYSGHLYDQANVNIQIGDARNVIARTDENYDIIMMSLIDTWAAGQAGAFALTENNLYTKEAFRDYYRHLTDDGILTVSRWHYTPLPGEMLRLVSVAIAAWGDEGAPDIERSIMVIGKPHFGAWDDPNGVATLLIKRTPFTVAEIEEIERVSDQLKFDILYTPSSPNDAAISSLVLSQSPQQFWETYPLDVSPPTDDRPFFFHMLRLRDFYKMGSVGQGYTQNNVKAVAILVGLLIVTGLLSVAFIVLPLIAVRRQSSLSFSGRVPLAFYFANIGLAFILVEIPLIQRFTLFLGHPVYSLSIVLFSLLLFSGIGSYITRVFGLKSVRNIAIGITLALVAVITFHAFVIPSLLQDWLPWDITFRIAIVVATLIPLGLLMGMPFPLGIKVTAQRADHPIPWFWGINGVMSVLASILATAIALHYGFTYALLAGGLAYAGASLTMLLARTSAHPAPR